MRSVVRPPLAPWRPEVLHAGVVVAAAASVWAAAARPDLILPLLAAAAAAAGLLLIPSPCLPGLLVMALVAVSFARETEIAPWLGPVLGVSRITLVISAAVLLRGLLGTETARMPVSVLGPLFAFALALLVSVAAAVLRGTTYVGLVEDVARQAGYATAFGLGLVAAQDARGRPRLFRGLAWATILAAGLSCFYGVWAAGRWPLGPAGLDAFLTRIRAGSAFDALRSIVPFVHEGPNLSAVAFALLGAFVAPRLLLGGSRRETLLGAALVVSVAGAIISTASRSGLVLLVVAPLPLLACGSSRRIRAAAAAAVGTALLAAVASEHLLPEPRPFSLSDPNFVARLEVWRQGLDLVRASPLVGHGYQYSVRGPLVETIPAAPGQDWAWRPASVHSDYLGQLIEGGVLGASAFGAFLAGITGLALRLLRRGATRYAGLSLLSLVTALVTAMTVASVWQSPVASTLIWLCLGISAAESVEPPIGGVT